MNVKAIAVLGWAGLSLYVMFRDWGKSAQVLQELAGIWLLSVAALVISEGSGELAAIAEAFLIVDVLIKPGTKDVGQSFAETVSQILPSPTTTTSAATAAAPKGAVV